MTIRKFWLDASQYSLIEAAYLACGLEPQNSKVDPPQLVLNVLKQMNGAVVEKHPELRGKSTKDVWFEIDFVRGWAEYVGETDFFKLKSDQIEKPVTESERNKLLKQIGLLALVLAENAKKYNKGDKPNVNRVVTTAQEITELFNFIGKAGTAKSELSKSISAGLKLLEEDD